MKKITAFLLCMTLILSVPLESTAASAYIVSSTDPKYTYSDFKKDMDQLVEKYPDRLTKKYLGKTVDNRGLYSITLGNSDGIAISALGVNALKTRSCRQR